MHRLEKSVPIQVFFKKRTKIIVYRVVFNLIQSSNFILMLNAPSINFSIVETVKTFKVQIYFSFCDFLREINFDEKILNLSIFLFFIFSEMTIF